MSLSECRVTRVFPKGESYPTVVTFQNRIEPSTLKRSECHVLRGPGRGGQTALVTTENGLYTGREYEDSSLKNALVVRNKTTGEISIVDVGVASLKMMLPELEERSTIVDDEATLGEKFGSKRLKRAIEQNKKMKVDMNTVKEQLETSIKHVKTDLSEIVSEKAAIDSSIYSYTPPADRSAADAQNVYKLKSIITDEQSEVLRVNAETVLSTEDYDNDMCKYVLQFIKSLRVSNSPNRLQSCCALLYTDCLIRYLTDSYKQVSSLKYKACSYSEVINNAVFDNFSVPNDKGRTRPQNLKDKTVCYVIVLLLLANDCKIPDFEDLRKNLKVPATTLTQMINVVGARITTIKANKSIVLSLPLTEPPPIKTRKQKK